MSKPYHHGALREALLAAAENIIETSGVDGLTLRAVARDAGVSHAAPAHHFGDVTGLLSELAARGFDRFSDRLESNSAGAADQQQRVAGLCRGYVGFAQDSPGLFQLMFRSSRLDRSRPALAISGARAFSILLGQGPHSTPDLSDTRRVKEAVETWSLVHGFSMLIIDGRLTSTMKTFSGPEVETLSAMIFGGADVKTSQA
jgi:AcrR family transcriptional regulator